jgi:serine/threonine protein kinase
MKILSTMRHASVVRFYDSVAKDGVLSLIIEYCDHGDLHQRILDQKGKLFEEAKIWTFFIQITLGLQYIHSKRILHRDIKTLNIFLAADHSIRIGDFGVAKILGKSQFAHTLIGTPYYLSPELLQDLPYNEKSDIWALGVTLYELCTLTYPFDAKNQGALVLKIVKGHYAPIAPSYSADLKKVLSALLQKDVHQRPSALQILQYPTVIERAKALNLYHLFDSIAAGAVSTRASAAAASDSSSTNSSSTTSATAAASKAPAVVAATATTTTVSRKAPLVAIAKPRLPVPVVPSVPPVQPVVPLVPSTVISPPQVTIPKAEPVAFKKPSVLDLQRVNQQVHEPVTVSKPGPPMVKPSPFSVAPLSARVPAIVPPFVDVSGSVSARKPPLPSFAKQPNSGRIIVHRMFTEDLDLIDDSNVAAVAALPLSQSSSASPSPPRRHVQSSQLPSQCDFDTGASHSGVETQQCGDDVDGVVAIATIGAAGRAVQCEGAAEAASDKREIHVADRDLYDDAFGPDVPSDVLWRVLGEAAVVDGGGETDDSFDWECFDTTAQVEVEDEEVHDEMHRPLPMRQSHSMHASRLEHVSGSLQRERARATDILGQDLFVQLYGQIVRHCDMDAELRLDVQVEHDTLQCLYKIVALECELSRLQRAD